MPAATPQTPDLPRAIRLHHATAMVVGTILGFTRHGAKIIFAARFMPGLRAVLFATAGIFRVRPLKFILIDGSAALASVPLLIWLGERFGARLEEIAKDARNAQLIGAGCLVGAVALWCVWEYYQVRRRKRMAAALPLANEPGPAAIEPPAPDMARAAKPPALVVRPTKSAT